MNLRTKRVAWGNIAITVREETGLDTFQEPHFFWRIVGIVHGANIQHSSELEAYESHRISSLVTLINRTIEIEGDLGLKWPDIKGSDNEIKAAYESLDNLPGSLIRKWRDAINEISVEPMGDPDLAPPEHLDKKKEETKLSKESAASSESTLMPVSET